MHPRTKMFRTRLMCIIALCTMLFASGCASITADPLPSWNDGPAKHSITTFVARVTTPGSKDFVAVPERIAAFDNDGTLWAEQPVYSQILFVLERVKVLAPQHPEWRTEEPFSSVLKGDLKGVFAGGDKSIEALIAATSANMSTAEFDALVTQWIATARHPRFNQPYTAMVYQPMLELMTYLRANGFKTFIVSGGSMEFMRPWAEKTYGVPPEQVVGSSNKTRFEAGEGKPTITILPEIASINDGPGKPLGIYEHIGRRPIFAFGNSDGDLEMLQWTAAGHGASFMGLVHHTDAVREWAYDRDSSIGKLSVALDVAQAQGWTVVDMQRDWAVVFPFQAK